MALMPNYGQSNITQNATQSVQALNYNLSRMQKDGQRKQTVANNHGIVPINTANTTAARYSRNHAYIRTNR